MYQLSLRLKPSIVSSLLTWTDIRCEDCPTVFAHIHNDRRRNHLSFLCGCSRWQTCWIRLSYYLRSRSPMFSLKPEMTKKLSGFGPEHLSGAERPSERPTERPSFPEMKPVSVWFTAWNSKEKLQFGRQKPTNGEPCLYRCVFASL